MVWCTQRWQIINDGKFMAQDMDGLYQIVILKIHTKIVLWTGCLMNGIDKNTSMPCKVMRSLGNFNNYVHIFLGNILSGLNIIFHVL